MILPIFIPMLYRYTFLILIFLTTTCQQISKQSTYLGLLSLHGITYHLFLDKRKQQTVLINATFKYNPMELDTIWFPGDSIRFRLKEFYSEYKGQFHKATNSFRGVWIAEDSTVHPLIFNAVLPDTVTGLKPRIAAYQYKLPEQLNDGLQTGAREAAGISLAVDTLMNHIIKGKYADIHSLLIARNNQLVVEEYFYRFTRDKVYNIQSATKSIVSALTGIAIGKGEIKGVRETLCTNLPEYKRWTCDQNHKDITLHQVLSMSTGIEWDEKTYDYIDERNSNAIAARDSNQFIHVLTLPRKNTVPSVFAYNSVNHLMINAVLRNTTGLENEAELRDRILKPLAIEQVYIDEPTPMGVIGDIGLRPRDMLKFGLLYANKGRWNTMQLVPEDWVRESTETKINVLPSLGYGYFWWTKEFAWKGKTLASFFAWGYGGQYIFVVPELNLVVVMSGSHWGTDPQDQGVPMMEEILSAID